MSFDAMRCVLLARFDCGIERAIAIDLANRANNKTLQIWASVPTIVQSTGFGATKVRGTLKKLRALGVIVLIGTRSCRTGFVNLYRFDLNAVGAMPRLSRASRADVPSLAK